jgi:nitrogen fixation protein NifU and related proteins
MMRLNAGLSNGIFSRRACTFGFLSNTLDAPLPQKASRPIAPARNPCHTDAMYSPAVLDHFKNPRHAGQLDGASVQVEVSNPVCGDVMRLAARVQDGRIAEAKFLARGCVTAIACGSLLAERMQGASRADLSRITPEQISEVLGGLPAATFHGAQLACDALAALLEKITTK